MKYLEGVNVALNGLLMVMGGFAVLALMTVATANVVLRMVHAPYRGACEVVSFLGAVVIAFPLGYGSFYYIPPYIIPILLLLLFPYGTVMVLSNLVR
jgi:hypothetical protein